MPGNRGNSKKRSEKAIKKSRPPGKRLKDIKTANVGLRRSKRHTSNAFASDRITANRLTIPLTFLDRGIRSETVSCRKENVEVVSQRNKHILNEDLLALIPPADIKGQSAELVGPPTSSLKRRFDNASSYYLSCISNQATCSEFTKDTTVLSKSDIPVDNSTSDRLEEVDEESEYNPTIAIENLTTNTSSINNTLLSDKIRPVNYKFSHNLFEQIQLKLRGAKRSCILRLGETIEKMNDILDGKRPPASTPKPKSTKRLSEDDYDAQVQVSLVPQSEWVYSTPDKQNIKKFVFDEGSTKILPAVIRTSKKCKVLYDIKNEMIQQISLTKFKSGQNIPIDRRYLKTICENTIQTEDMVVVKPSKKQRLDDISEKENMCSYVAPAKKPGDFVFQPQAGGSKDEFNVFLSGASEESIDIHKEMERDTETVMDVSFEAPPMAVPRRNSATAETNEHFGNFDFGRCRSALPKDCFHFTEDAYEKAPRDYHHQLLLATQRPSKTNRMIPKRHALKAKSLSFEYTPPGAKVALFEPKRLDLVRKFEEDCLDEFEKEFPSLNTANTRDTLNLPHTMVSGDSHNIDCSSSNVANATDVEMEEQFNIASFNDNLRNTFKFYPRRNFDPE